MRLLERGRVEVEIAPRVRRVGALGGRAEAFSDARQTVRASRIDQRSELDARACGPVDSRKLKLLVPADTAVGAGDALWLGEVRYVVRSVSAWTAHKVLECEAAN